jgi:hypothetical protein
MFGLIILWVPNELIVGCVKTYWSNSHKLTLHLKLSNLVSINNCHLNMLCLRKTNILKLMKLSTAFKTLNIFKIYIAFLKHCKIKFNEKKEKEENCDLEKI